MFNMNYFKFLFSFFLIFSIAVFGFGEQPNFNIDNFEVQNDIEVQTIYDNSINYFIYILITGFSIIIVSTYALVYKQSLYLVEE